MINIYIVVGTPVVTIGIGLTIALHFLKNPEEIDKWSALYNKFKFWKDENRERKIISKTLDYKITRIAKHINSESEGILPYGLRVKWTKPDEVISYIEQNEVIVVLSKDENSDKNIVEACSAFVPKALLPTSRNCIDETLLKAMDQYVIKQILSYGSFDSSYNYFMKHFFSGIIKSHPTANLFYNHISKVDTIGFFTRVLLEEFRRFGLLLYGTSEETSFKNESTRFLTYLYNIANRQHSERVKLQFLGEKIKIGIIFVAQRATLEKWGLEAHISRIKKDVDIGIKRVYVFSYAHSYDEMIYDKAGYVVDYKTKKTFKSLSQLEKECRKINNITFLKKQNYITKDASGKNRRAKYLLFQST
ncbi:MAG: hypothetical protein KAS53_09465 [Candidatus Cloacimonetes bacterium]|nr:hypothetical protein [Candidatus Cloacimonadota bacterium]